jgi:hypothetical protein
MKSKKESSFKVLFLKIPAAFFSVAVSPLFSSTKDLQVALPDNAEHRFVIIKQQDDADTFSTVRISPLSVKIFSTRHHQSTSFLFLYSSVRWMRKFVAKDVLFA